MVAEFASNTFRALFAAIDSGIYSLISYVYQIIEELISPDFSIINSNEISDFASRVYVLVGMLMLFKVTFSLINYLVNPDMINDKKEGVGNIAKNIIITLVLIIITPYAFDFAYRVQNAIISDNLITKVILGTSENENGNNTIQMSPLCGDKVATTDNTGTYLSLIALRPFYQITEGITDISEIENVYCSASTANNAPAKVSVLLESDVYKAEGTDDKYIVDYSILLSTVCGIVVFILLITITMDIALRAIKLAFLEILAPIPIISYIDPKQGKDGIFKKWLKETFKTWLSLFIKLATLTFAIYIISLIDSAVANLKNQDLGIWVSLFILIGALMFVKQFPKLLEDIFGIKLDGMSLHPIKKIQEQATLGKQVTGLGGAAVVGAGAAIGGFAANNINNIKRIDDLKKDYDGNKLKIAGKFASQSIAGLGYGAFRGIQTGYKAGKDGKLNIPGQFLDAVQQQSADRNLNETLVKQTDYKHPFAKAKYDLHNKWTDVIGIQGASGSTDELKNKLKALSAEKADVENQYSAAVETLSRLQSNSSNFFNDTISQYGDPFKREYMLDENNHPKISKTGAMEFKPMLTFEEYKNKNQLLFNDEEETSFRREYDRRYNAEKAYRDSFNRMLEIQKTEGKLTKDQEKMTGKKS